MYIPRSFAVDEAETLYQFMRANNFATLVTHQDGRLNATPLPFMVDSERGVLWAHMARANKQWKEFDVHSQALVIFQGPHAYISPTWYHTHPSIPTWNYTTVHIYGTPHLLDDDLTMRQMLEALVINHEQNRDPEWQMALPEDYLQQMMQSIVAFEIPIERIEGKFKLSQNRSEADQDSVITHLAASASPLDRETSRAMADRRAQAK